MLKENDFLPHLQELYIRCMSLITRIAPTPSGFLHKGNAFNFLLIYSLAKKFNAKILLRIDDNDSLRCKDEYIEDIFASLEWLGISWDLGPCGVEDFKKNWSQSIRIDKYNQTLETLKSKGLLFACNCSRKQLADYIVYPQTCLNKNLPFDFGDITWRIKTSNTSTIAFVDEILDNVSTDLNKSSGWAVVRRRDGLPAYHIASLTDDILYGVNLIARGADLIEATAIQLFIADALGSNSFSNTLFYHHPLLKKPDGEKLSKSKDDTSLKYMREQGYKKEQLLAEFNLWLSSLNIQL